MVPVLTPSHDHLNPPSFVLNTRCSPLWRWPMVGIRRCFGSATWYALDATERELSGPDQVSGVLSAGSPMTQIKDSQLSHQNRVPQTPCTSVSRRVRKRVNKLGPCRVKFVCFRYADVQLGQLSQNPYSTHLPRVKIFSCCSLVEWPSNNIHGAGSELV